MDFVKNESFCRGNFPPENHFAVFRDIPIEVSTAVFDETLGQRSLAYLAGAAEKNHLFRQVAPNLRSQISFHRENHTAFFDNCQIYTRVFLMRIENARMGVFYKLGLTTPPDTINLKASSMLMSVKMTSSWGTRIAKPVSGPGELVTKTLHNFLLVCAQRRGSASLVRKP